MSAAPETSWKRHEVQQLNGSAPRIRHIAALQIITEDWDADKVVFAPSLVYMPEEDTLLMLVNYDWPQSRAMFLISEDYGGAWREVGSEIAISKDLPSGCFVGLTYLGKGKVALCTESNKQSLCYLSADCGQSWECVGDLPPHSDGKPWYGWDPFLVDRDPATGEVTRLWQAAHGCLRSSTDLAQTWSQEAVIPQWGTEEFFVSEVALIRAGNGDMLAACRAVVPKLIAEVDHGAGLGTSVSKDNGRTWSQMNRLYLYGRHHPSMVLTLNGDIVMSHVVRQGYVRTVDGFMQFGVEAVVSRDNGRTWDLDHKYMLAVWKASHQDSRAVHESSQSTSTVQLPDGTLLTAFGTGYRFKEAGPGDIGLVRWRPGDEELGDDNTITAAPFDSDRRNVFDPLIFNYAMGSDEEG